MKDPVDYKKLRDLRIDNDMKQKEIAAKLNITPSAYSRLESGKRQIRTEQLNIIAQVLGKNITYFFKKSTHDESIEENAETLKAEISLLKSMLHLLSVGVEQELDYLDNQYISKYEPIKYSFSDFIEDGSSKIALLQFKKYIKEYEDLMDRPYEWYKEQLEKTFPNYNQQEKNPDWINSLIDYKEKFEFNGNRPFNMFFSKEHYEYFKDKSDEFIMDFILDEENFDFVEMIMNDGVGSGYSYSEEDNYSAFKDMLEENHLVRLLFEYGFLSKTRQAYFWDKYLNDKGETFRSQIQPENNEVIEAIREKMNEIYSLKSPCKL